jgi:uncharacterized protein YegP (UPF0339 family)
MSTKKKLPKSLTIEWFTCVNSAGEKNGNWAVRLIAGNGETMFVSEQYSGKGAKSNAKRSANRLFALIDPKIGDVVLMESA